MLHLPKKKSKALKRFNKDSTQGFESKLNVDTYLNPNCWVEGE